jgi:hypothetical protein
MPSIAVTCLGLLALAGWHSFGDWVPWHCWVGRAAICRSRARDVRYKRHISLNCAAVW